MSGILPTLGRLVKKRKETIQWTLHLEYFRIALERYEIIKKLKKEHDALQAAFKKKKAMSDDDVALLAEKNDAIGHETLIVIVFSALCLEAFINNYAIARLSKNYFTNYLDKLDTVAKWIVIPRVITRKRIDPGSKPVQDLSWLIAQRNRLVHYKSREIPIDEIKESDFFWEYDAEKAIKTVKGIVSKLKTIDGKVETDWLSLS